MTSAARDRAVPAYPVAERLAAEQLLRVLYRAAAADPRLAMEVRDEVVARYELALAAGVIPDVAVWPAWKALAEVHRRLDVAAAARGA